MNGKIAIVVAAIATAAAMASSSSASNWKSCYVGGWAKGGWAQATYVTSCPFARNVVRQADKNVWRYGAGRYHVNSWSPVTHRYYYMTCSTGRYGKTVCKGGSFSIVEWDIP